MASCPLRSDTPSASSSRTVVASVNGRRPPSAFSSVEMLSLACSARCCREMRRRASSSRMVAATHRLCSADSCRSVTCIIPLVSLYPNAKLRRNPHRAAQIRTPPPSRRRSAAEQCRSSRSRKRAPSRTTPAQCPREHAAQPWVMKFRPVRAHSGRSGSPRCKAPPYSLELRHFLSAPNPRSRQSP